MTGKTHFTVGLSTFVCLSERLPGKYVVISLIFTILGSMLPDIDHPKSFVNKYILPFRNNTTKVFFYITIGAVLLYIDSIYNNNLILKILGMSFILIGLSTHREGFTHSVFGMLVFTFVVSTFGKIYKFQYLQYYFLAGFGMHLLCDMFTRKGVPLLYPIKNKKFKFPMAYSSNSKRGKIIENIIILLSIVYVTLSLPKFFIHN